METITKRTAKRYEQREKAFREWLGDRSSYHPSELPNGIKPLTNKQRGYLEFYYWQHDKPLKYFLYVDRKDNNATTWNGVVLGKVHFGRGWRDNFGGARVSIDVYGNNG